jgi:tRNA(His) 5'-end guanylyltransferase
MPEYQTIEYEYFKRLESITMYESYANGLDNRKMTVIRCDGHCFHTYTRGFLSPFDPVLHYCLDKAYLNTVKALFGNLWLCLYSQSDEVTIILYPKLTEKKEYIPIPWGKVSKLLSLTPSRITSEFHIQLLKADYNTKAYEILKPFYYAIGNNHIIVEPIDDILKEPLAFDCRIFQTANMDDINRVLTWRRCDAINNLKQMWLQRYFPQKYLLNRKTNECLDNLFIKYKVDWKALPTLMKRGCYLQNPEWDWQSEFHESDEITKQYEAELRKEKEK